MTELTPEQIFSRYKNGKINKSEIIEYLSSTIENESKENVRLEVLEYLGELDFKSDEIFKLLENIVVADWSNFARVKAIKFLIRDYFNKGKEVIKWMIEHESFAKCLLSAYTSLELLKLEEASALMHDMEIKLGREFIEEYNLSPQEAFGLKLIKFQSTYLAYGTNTYGEGHMTYFKIEQGHVSYLSFRCIFNVENKLLKLFPYLKELEFERVPLLDLTNLMSLKILRIVDDEELESIQKLKALPTLINLEVLDLSHNSIRKIEGLETLINLKELNFYFNYIQELENLSNLKNLEVLNLFKNPIYEIKNLDALVNLQELDLSTDDKLGDTITQLKGLDKLINLKKLKLSTRDFTEIKGLEKLKSLEYLDLSGTDINKVKDLENLINLQYLNIERCKITELDGIQHLKNLKGLSMIGNPLKDIKVLNKLEGLEILVLDNRFLSEIEILSSLSNLKWLFCHPWIQFDRWLMYKDRDKQFGNQIRKIKKNK